MHLPSAHRALPRPALFRAAVPVLASLLASLLAVAPLRAAETDCDCEDAPTFAASVSLHFATWDADADGILTLDEIDRAIASPAVRGSSAAALVALRRASRSPGLDLPALTQASIAGLLDTTLRDPDDDRDQADTLAQYHDLALRRIATARRELFVSGQPRLETFRQGRLGSCFSLAPLAALIHRDPAEAAGLFTARPDGTYAVAFNAGSVSITVAAPTDGELALSATSGDDGIWPSVYEKAAGLLRTRPATDGAPTPTPYAMVTKGGSAGTMLSTLTGHPIRRFSCSPWRAKPARPDDELAAKLDELRALLGETFASGRLTTAGTPIKSAIKVPALANAHAYAVLSYDAATDRVTLRDPHGQTFTPKGEPGLKNGYPVEHGVWTAPLAEVVRFMGGFAFEQPPGGKLSNYATAISATASSADASD